MKAFQTYIFELSKPSQFRVKMANVEPVGEVLEHIKQALDAYQLETISPVKSVPIQEHREFPQWGPCEAWTFDVTLAYPTNLQDANDTADAEAPNADAAKGALLTQEDLGGSTEGQELAGQARIGSLLKELESRKFEFAEDSKESGKTTNDEAQGETSPVGTKQNKINDQRKGNTK
jgi:hypothetical protein